MTLPVSRKKAERGVAVERAVELRAAIAGRKRVVEPARCRRRRRTFREGPPRRLTTISMSMSCRSVTGVLNDAGAGSALASLVESGMQQLPATTNARTGGGDAGAERRVGAGHRPGRKGAAVGMVSSVCRARRRVQGAWRSSRRMNMSERCRAAQSPPGQRRVGDAMAPDHNRAPLRVYRPKTLRRVLAEEEFPGLRRCFPGRWY